MRDVHIDELSDRLREKFGLKIPKRDMRKLTRSLFKEIGRIAATDRDRLTFGGYTDIIHFYTNPDIIKLCQDMAEGKDVQTITSRKRLKAFKKYIQEPRLELLDA